jgi:hypothetical protein
MQKFVEHGEQRIDCTIAKRKTEQQETWQSVKVLQAVNQTLNP